MIKTPLRRQHQPVLLVEVLEALMVQPGGRYVDCTVGGGGHAAAILDASSPGGQLLGIDADPMAIREVRERLSPYGRAVALVNDSFRRVREICREHGWEAVHGILFDLGLSSMQLEDERGFSFQRDAPLDMRFDPSQRVTAADVVNGYPERDLVTVIARYGEEPQATRIARAIVKSRPLRTSGELAEVVSRAVGGVRGRIHPATRTFQALRIVTNDELESLAQALEQAALTLGAGGRLAVISFHSLEDRLVKGFLRREAQSCLCPPEVPICVCEHQPTLRIITRKPVSPSMEEKTQNPRSRSARLRVGEKLARE